MVNRRVVMLLVLAALGGCAATVKTSSDASAVRVPAESATRLVLNMSGPPRSSGAKDWEAFKGEWRGAFQTQARLANVAFSFQEGAPQPTGEEGTLLSVYVDDYRYLSSGTRYGLGIFAGNAFIESKIRFVNLKTGAAFGERDYNTSSTAWQGIFSAMTDKQVDAIAADVLRQLKSR